MYLGVWMHGKCNKLRLAETGKPTTVLTCTYCVLAKGPECRNTTTSKCVVLRRHNVRYDRDRF